MRRLAKDPALHFALLGALVYLGWSWAGGEPAVDRQRVEVPMHRIAAAVKEFERTVARRATPDEVAEVAAIVADEEVLLAYALDLDLDREPVVERRLAQIAQFVGGFLHLAKVEDAGTEGGQAPNEASAARSTAELAAKAREIGLHRQDLITRRILIDSARRLIRAAALVREPTDEMVADYLDAHPEEFSRPGETRISQLHLPSNGDRDALRSEAEALLQRLQAEGTGPEKVLGLEEDPDDTVLPSNLPLLPEREIARYFGSRFTKALSELPVGSWQGPIASPYGLHLVYVHERTPAQVPALSEIRAEVVARTRQKLADDWLAFRLLQLRGQYDVVMPPELS